MNKKILIAEDEESLRDALSEILIDAGFEVITAADGNECLDKLFDELNTPDLLILDIIMPFKDGLDVLNTMLVKPNRPNIPIIVLTNKSDFNTKHKALEYGAHAYFVKSDATLEQIVDKVQELLLI